MKIEIILNEQKIKVEDNLSILDICKSQGINIPTLCFQKGLFPEGRCRICLVEMDGKLVTSCSTKPKKNAKILTNTEKVRQARKKNLELINPTICRGNVDNEHLICELYKEVGLESNRFEPLVKHTLDLGDVIIRDNNKCINCGRCVQVCSQIQAVHALDFSSRGHNAHVTPYMNKKLSEVACIKCGQCIISCPVGAIYERSHIEAVEAAIKDPKKHVIAQTAPSIRVSLGELFSMEGGSLITGKMVSAIKSCGFDRVFDVNLAADLTIMEEGTEFLKRLESGGKFPMITSCCPGWVLMAEHFHHDLLDNLSTCKSPQEMMGSMIKTYYAKKKKIDPKDIVVVSIMPCTAKKFESNRPEMKNMVDYVLTTREIAKLIKKNQIDLKNIKEKEFDKPLGISTGAGAIFGVSG